MSPSDWAVIGEVHNQPVTEGVLEQFDTRAVANGTYTIRLTATDRCGNPGSVSVCCEVLNIEPPTSFIYTPATDSFVGGVTQVLGTATGDHFDRYSLYYSLSGQAKWQPIAENGQGEVTDGLLALWETATLDEVSYDLKLTAWNVVGGESGHQISGINVDNNNPQALITSPTPELSLEEEQVITGTASDSHFEYYELQYASGENPENWTLIGERHNTAVEGGELGTWQVGELASGDYTLRLVVKDLSGKVNEALVPVKIENQVLARIEITPGFDVINHAQQLQFQARGYDEDGNVLEITPSWSCDPDVGTIDSQGLFVASQYGTTDVTATVGEITATAQIQVPSYLSGTEYNNITLKAKYNPYVVTANYTIGPGATLTIEPGVVIKARPNFNIRAEGRIVAQGTNDNRINITSIKDDTVWGDTNDDGNSSTPAAGNWSGIIFAGSTSSNFSNTNIYYAGYGITITGGAHNITDNNISKCHTGVSVLSCTPLDTTITNNTFTSCADYAIDLGNNRPTITGNSGLLNGKNGINVNGTYTGDYTWNSTNHGPLVDGEPTNALTYVIVDGLNVSAGSTLEVEAGTVVKFTGNGGRAGMGIGGVMLSQGTPDNPVTFTSLADDLAGGNTSGGTSTGSPGAWGGLSFGSSSEESTLDYTNIRFGGYRDAPYGTTISLPQLQVTNGSHKFNNCCFSNAGGGQPLVVSGGAPTVSMSQILGPSTISGGNPTISGCPDITGTMTISGGESIVSGNAFHGTGGEGIKVTCQNNDTTTITNNVFTNCGNDGIYIKGGLATITWNNLDNCPTAIKIENCAGGSNISNNTVEGGANGQYGILVNDCGDTTTIASNTVNNCSEYWGVITNHLENTDIYDNKGTGCKKNGIELSDYNWDFAIQITLKKNDVPYVLMKNDFIVPEDSLFRLLPGVTIKCLSRSIIINGTFICEGTASEQINVTSVYDESHDDCIALEGEASSNNWGGITVNNNNVTISNTYLGYGGNANGLLHINNCSPSITEIDIMNGLEYSINESAGTGVAFNGDCGTNLTKSTISYCDKAIIVQSPGSGSGNRPVINNCNLWKSDYGVYIDGGDVKDPINAQNNDWCETGVENGPAPAGDGSGVNNFDMVDVLPWVGLGQNHAQDNDNDATEPEVGIVYRGDDRPFGGACEGFADTCETNDLIVRQRKGTEDSGDYLRGDERDLRDYFAFQIPAATQGHDPLSFDNVDLGFYSGHGVLDVPKAVMYFGNYNAGDSEILTSDKIVWGDQDLEWAVIYNCHLMQPNDQAGFAIDKGGVPGAVPEDPMTDEDYPIGDYVNIPDIDSRFKANTIDEGLHILLGFATFTYINGGVGSSFADYISNRSHAISIREAWFESNQKYQPIDCRSEEQIWSNKSIWDPHNIAIAYGAEGGYINDYFWGRGPTMTSDPCGSGSFVDTQVCARDESPSFESGEYPDISFSVIDNEQDDNERYKADPGDIKVFKKVDDTSLGSVEYVRLREHNASGHNKYVNATILSVSGDLITVRIPGSSVIEREKSYDMLFLNNNMTFGYLILPLGIKPEEQE